MTHILHPAALVVIEDLQYHTVSKERVIVLDDVNAYAGSDAGVD
jgi:hypothetical protein